jgi:hypothetical protein
MFIIGFIKTLLSGVFDSFYSVFIKTNITDIPFEERESSTKRVMKSIIFLLITAFILLLLYTIKSLTIKLDSKNSIIANQVAIVRECRSDESVENIPKIK